MDNEREIGLTMWIQDEWRDNRTWINSQKACLQIGIAEWEH
jgi:hypothetical protein